MKNNFVIRTGKSSGFNLADEVEKRLRVANLLPTKRIPRSNFNRLLSAESLRNRVGISVKKGRLEYIRDEQATLQALHRIATDLATREVTLDDIWDTESKLEYIDDLDEKGVLPKASQKRRGPVTPTPSPAPLSPKPPALSPAHWPHLIPNVNYGITWASHLQRHREIWEELQFKLEFGEHSNAISVLLRVLFELSIDNYVKRACLTTVQDADKLARKAAKVADDLHSKDQIDRKYLGAITKLQQGEELISIDTLNRYVHSPNFNVSPDHLRMLWATLSGLIVHCLKA